ncbi:MAG: SRPBCC family protein [Candidatus Limnocylindrales bacterium]
MAKIEHSIDIGVPVREAYNQWTQFESFPQFMDSVESVSQQGDRRLHWVAEIAGRREEWDAEITEQTPDQRIAWTSTSGDRNAGSVDFHRITDSETRVTLTMDVEPSGLVERVGTALGIPSGQVEGDLKRFKEFIESRGSATGAWRGEVVQDDVAGDRDLAGTGVMGSGAMRPALDPDDATGATAPTDESSGAVARPGAPSDLDTGTSTGTTGVGGTGTGLNDPQDMGTGRREHEVGF